MVLPQPTRLRTGLSTYWNRLWQLNVFCSRFGFTICVCVHGLVHLVLNVLLLSVFTFTDPVFAPVFTHGRALMLSSSFLYRKNQLRGVLTPALPKKWHLLSPREECQSFPNFPLPTFVVVGKRREESCKIHAADKASLRSALRSQWNKKKEKGRNPMGARTECTQESTNSDTVASIWLLLPRQRSKREVKVACSSEQGKALKI